MTTNIEKRTSGLGVEVRADSEKRTLVGYAAKFDRLASIGGYFDEKIASGAFTDAIKGDIRALVDHDPGRVIGRTKSGTLRLAEDGVGLRVEIDVPDTTDGNDLWVLVERGDISGMSFGFRVTKETWDETGDTPIRTIEKLELHEVSAVAWPAYEDTTIGLRSLEAVRAEGGSASRNAAAAARRVAEKRASSEQKFRGIRQDVT
ncbi:HK97 family phage prohead protease [Rhizobium rhizogenes]|uniref:Prohead protease n=1 Tax=Rhizobium rhizogenes NBRC 13257 TaxID=1220581 RepID=A0AA87U2P5_RHIRH|nr:HK97 family phage prohead protease [Rhizobium rhizogenes]NTG67277.1 HK97 family phage prohead protease [Rhizobium rhizogenes]TRB14325.1 HK97 family phage prohead protease [Rhizobium rhizogenes]TRB47115.1 HK97 family phage prohead protease [Rhizobium rhizogenes]TRB64882.1 HK97 family phage prohead protease [Rhizobium rhizogenes]GAJ91030.1 putative prohead protease [Rhizobium rhizogenes NBRC 13257]